MSKLKSTADRGKFKNEIHTALYKSENIKNLLLGDTAGKSANDIRKLFREHVKSHLFIDDTITATESFIFYDVILPTIKPQVKECRVVLYAICHRDILDGDDFYVDGYYGNRADVLSQMIEDCLINDEETANSFGIGKLSLDSVDIFNDKRFYGCIMMFSVPNFR